MINLEMGSMTQMGRADPTTQLGHGNQDMIGWVGLTIQTSLISLTDHMGQLCPSSSSTQPDPTRLGRWHGLAPLGSQARPTHLSCRAICVNRHTRQVCVDGSARLDKVVGLVGIARVIVPIRLV